MDPKGKSGLARIRLPNVDYRRCSETRRKERLFLEREVGERSSSGRKRLDKFRGKNRRYRYTTI